MRDEHRLIETWEEDEIEEKDCTFRFEGVPEAGRGSCVDVATLYFGQYCGCMQDAGKAPERESIARQHQTRHSASKGQLAPGPLLFSSLKDIISRINEKVS